ncbi:MAG: enoyl-CoA hydratase-related protein [Paracoccaceae bacterium]
MTDPVLLHIAGPVAQITFDRPDALNAIDVALAQAFDRATSAAVATPGVRVIVLSGNGRAFMAGGDLAAFRQSDDRAAEAEAIIAPMNSALSRLHGSGILTLALLQGPVAGAGLSLALAADFAIAAETAMLSFAYLKIGAPADCGISWTLPRAVGLRRALWLAMEGSALPAGQALDWGLVTRVVPADALAAEGARLAARLAALAPGAAAALKTLMLQGFGQDFTATLETEKQAFRTAAATDDFAEALEAFFEKRPARFTGN